MSERDVYHKPETRVLLRTADVYQTEVADEVTDYSEQLLAIVADFKNSGKPEGTNAQSMVGKSKRGEVACRLFARIDPDTGIIQAAGFKARGCLAMTGCASAVCLYIEGKGIEEVLALTVEDVSKLVGGVPTDKTHALYFAVCAVRALVGDFLLRDGCSVAQLDEAVLCDPLSIPCIMAEHCSLRQSRLECLMEEEDAKHSLLEHDACVAVFDRIRTQTAEGRLSSREDWDDLLPAHLMPNEFQEVITTYLDEESEGEDLSYLSPSSVKAKKSSDVFPKKEASEFANRGVGIPKLFNNTASSDSGEKTASIMPETKRALNYESSASGLIEEDIDLVPPDGYKLVQIDGVWGLVEDAEDSSEASPKEETPIDARGIKTLKGAKKLYFYDSNIMKPTYARWAYLAQEDDPLTAFVFLVREDSRVYPRPMAQSSFSNNPINMDKTTVVELFNRVQASEDYDDIHEVVASNGDVYYFSSDYLSAQHAQSLAEWASVERFMNV